MPPRTINSRRCNVCKIEKTLSKNETHLCTGCNLIRYCGRDHQRLDWRFHKPFCTAVKHILRINQIDHIMELNGPVTSWIQFEKALILAKCLLHTILKRELEIHELELLTFPVHCQICFSRVESKTFFNCPTCESVSYCSQDHKNEDFESHSKWCLYLKYYYDFYDLDDKSAELDFTKAPILDCGSMPNDLFKLIEMVSKGDQSMKINKFPKTLTEFQSYSTVSDFSCVATILYAIHRTHSMVNEIDVLTIYMIGAREEHLYLQEPQCAFLSSQLPSIKEFNFYLIGPEIQRKSKSLTFSVSTHQRETVINLNFEKVTFENFVQNNKANNTLAKMPHLIAAFNCGFHEYSGTQKDTWKRGIGALIEFENIPIVATSYTKLESKFDLREMSVCGLASNRLIQIVANGEENPYKDYRPFRNMELNDRKDLVYFRNGYLNIAIVSSYG